MNNADKINADRFKGFAEVYDNSRPTVPAQAIELMLGYLGKTADRVVDLGCGTGLSTAAWKCHAKEIIGIEPSDDMLAQANKKADDDIRFVKGFSDNTGLEANSADIVVCSQSFHWMDPVNTLKEVDRILKKGGAFATVDCDWPAVFDLEAEKEYDKLFTKVKRIELENDQINRTFSRWDKEHHLENIKKSGVFSYVREIVFLSDEPCTPQRFINLALSQGGLQAILKADPSLIQSDLDSFIAVTKKVVGKEKCPFCYRMRIGVK